MTKISARVVQLEQRARADGRITQAEANAVLNAASTPEEKKAARKLLADDGFIAAPKDKLPVAHAHEHHADKGVKQGVGQKPAAKKQEPLGYDRATYDVKPAGEYETRETVDSDLLGSASQGHVINGAKTDEEYIVAAHAIESVAQNPDAWNKETDLLVKIDGKPRHVTVRLNDVGKVEAEIAPDTGKWIPAKDFKSRNEAIKALEKDFGVKVPKKGLKLDDNWDGPSKDFTTAELTKLYDGLSRLTPAEREGLKGVKLVRIDSFADGSAGMFESGTTTKKGVTTRDDRLVLANSAFENDGKSVIGDRVNAAPASIETITHEAGHAVETMDLRKAELTEANIRNKTNGAGKKANDEFNKNVKAAKGDDFKTAAKDARTAFDDLRLNDDASQVKQLRDAANEALQKAKDELANLPPKDQPKAKKALESLEKFAKVANTRADALEALDAADGKDGSHSTKLEAFEKLVTDKNIAPFTKYAKDSGEIDEFYAEAFALYKSDPKFLEKNHKAVFDFFTNGGGK